MSTTPITIEVSDTTLAAFRKFVEREGMSVEGYLISVVRAHARAARNPLHQRILHLVSQGMTDGDIAAEIGMNQTATSVGTIRRKYHVAANRKYRKAGA